MASAASCFAARRFAIYPHLHKPIRLALSGMLHRLPRLHCRLASRRRPRLMRGHCRTALVGESLTPTTRATSVFRSLCCAMAAFRRLEYERSCGMGGEGVARDARNGEAAFGAHEPTRGLARRANPCERIPTDRAHRRASHEREGPENTFPPIPMRSASRARSARTIAIRDVNPPKPHPHPKPHDTL